MDLFLPIFFIPAHECKRNNDYTHKEHYTHLLTKTPYKDEETREKTLSQRGNKNKKMNLKVDLIPSGNSKETDTGGI